MKASDVFVKSLENEGIEYIFGLPGEENLDILESIRNSSITFIPTRHEQGAGFMAATIGRLTGKPGVCLSTLGPGATNLITPAAYATLGGMPMVILTGQKPIKEPKQGHFQIIDTVEVMKPVTKSSRQIVNGNRVSALVRDAFRIASEERPGAVHLELPEDIAKEESKYPPTPISLFRRPIAEEKAIDQAVKIIERSTSPLILVGSGANRKMVSKMLTKFINETNIPFFNTQMGKGVVDERIECFLGTAALSDKDTIHQAIEKADLIINVGHDVVEKPPFIMKPSDTRKVVHINFFSAQVDNVYFPNLEVIGDIANSIWQISEKLKIQNWDFSFTKGIQEQILKNIQGSDKKTNYIKPENLVKTTRKILEDDAIVCLDNGMYKLWFAKYYKTYKPNTLLLDNALATMGAGLPSAMASKLLNPQKQVLAVVGDGGFMMNSQEIETAIRLNLDLTVLVLVDNKYGMIKWKQNMEGYKDFGLDFNNPDFKQYAESYNAKGFRINNLEDLRNSLPSIVNGKGLNIVEIPIDYSDNKKIFG